MVKDIRSGFGASAALSPVNPLMFEHTKEVLGNNIVC